MEEIEKIALEYLPTGVQRIIKLEFGIGGKTINEVRLRLNKRLALTVGRVNVLTDYICTGKDISLTVSNLCQGSLYSYSDYILDGVIPTEHGIRAGVCGRAVYRDGRISCVRDITSINIRIPHRIIGASTALYELVMDRGSVIVFSPPGKGKTTLLRELIPLLASGKSAKRVSVIDSRFELSTGAMDCDSADVFLGYSRREGIYSAVRTMSPEYVLCDEIADSNDAESIMFAHSAGVKAVVTAHAGTYSELMSNKSIRFLVENGVFDAAYKIAEKGHEVIYIDS